MSRVAYVNGRYLPHGAAHVHIEDRGYQFSDAAYEVVLIYEARPLDMEPHLDRLDRSLRELEISKPMSRPALKLIMAELVRRNRLRNGIIYLQVSRGVAPRDHAFPKGEVTPATVMTVKRLDFGRIRKNQETGVSIKTFPDIRWARPDIKSVSLLGNVLAKESAAAEDAYEAWFVDDEGFITEGTSTNAWIVTNDRRILTRQLDRAILPGITRKALLGVAAAEGLEVEERAFSLDQALAASEAFLTSTTNFIMPVTAIDQHPIGKGEPGPVTRKLVNAYWRYTEDAVRRD